MKMNKPLFILAASLSLALCGCKDMEGEYDSIVPDDYHSIVTIKDSGVRNITFSVAEQQYHYPINILKGGSHIDRVTDVVLEVMTQEWLDDNYNNQQGTRYKTLSASMYSITDYHLEIGKGEPGKSADIVLNAPLIYSAMQNPANSDREFVLAVKIESSTSPVDPERSVVILHCNVSPVVVSFTETLQRFKMPDNAAMATSQIQLEKQGDFEATIHLEPMTQHELQAKYGESDDVTYQALASECYSFEADVTIPAETQFFTYGVELDVPAIREAIGAADGRTCVIPLTMTAITEGVEIGNSDVLLILTDHDYTFTDVVNKEAWSVVYGTIAMPFGKFEKMFDAYADGDGWMGYINDGFPNSQNLGQPYVVMDLSSSVMVSEIGVQVGYEGGWYDTMPLGVEFYVSDNAIIDPKLTDTEWNLLNAVGNYGNETTLSEDYVNLHNRLREFDSQIEWVKVGTISGLLPTANFTGQYWVKVSQSILSKQIMGRYLKVVPIPAGPEFTTGDRTKIHELYVRKVKEIDGNPI